MQLRAGETCQTGCRYWQSPRREARCGTSPVPGTLVQPYVRPWKGLSLEEQHNPSVYRTSSLHGPGCSLLSEGELNAGYDEGMKQDEQDRSATSSRSRYRGSPRH